MASEFTLPLSHGIWEWSYRIESSRPDEALLLNIVVPASFSSFCSSFSTTSPTYDLRQFHSSRLVLVHPLSFHFLRRACGRLTILHNFVKTYCHTNRPVIAVNNSRAKLRLPVSSIAIVDRYVIPHCQYEHPLFLGTPYTPIACLPLDCGKIYLRSFVHSSSLSQYPLSMPDFVKPSKLNPLC